MSGRCLAMWSGPRNISTAMMRSWENRADTSVVDEPLYAHYLAHTGIDHPMADEIIAAGNTDWHAITESLTHAPATGIFYQKHITTHMLPHITLDWLAALSHVFLIRHPAAVVASYAKKRETVVAADLGFDRQRELFDHVTRLQGQEPPVIDSETFLQDPAHHLQRLCEQLSFPFDPAMLDWPPGPRDSDGIWERHWYDAVKRSTGFSAATPRDDGSLVEAEREVVAQCLDDYQVMSEVARWQGLRASGGGG